MKLHKRPSRLLHPDAGHCLGAPGLVLSALLGSADERGQPRFLEVFAATIRNAHTRSIYARGAGECHSERSNIAGVPIEMDRDPSIRHLLLLQPQ